MSLPASQPIPPQSSAPLPPARSRRRNRSLVDLSLDERSAFVRQLAQRLTPGADFFFFSAASGAVAAVAILLDTPAMYILAALLAPFMAPAVGLSLATVVGSFRYFFETLASILIGAFFVFLFGLLGGVAASFLPGLTYQQTIFHTYFSWPDFLLLTLGAALTTLLLVRAPQSRPLVTSVALAYELYLPVGVAGYGLTSGVPGLWPDGLIVFAVHLGWVALIGTVVLALLGLRPLTLFGYTLASTIALVGIVAAVLLSGVGAMLAGGSPESPAAQSPAVPQETTLPTAAPPVAQVSPTVTPSARPTFTASLPPSPTPTVTITLAPTPVWARVYAPEFDGAVVRAEPGFDSKVIKIVDNGDLVEVLPATTKIGQTVWVNVRIPPENIEGWMVQTLLITATPAPNW